MAMPPLGLGYASGQGKVPGVRLSARFQGFRVSKFPGRQVFEVFGWTCSFFLTVGDLVFSKRFLQMLSSDVGRRRVGVRCDHGLIFPCRKVSLLLQIVHFTRAQVGFLQDFRVGWLRL